MKAEVDSPPGLSSTTGIRDNEEADVKAEAREALLPLLERYRHFKSLQTHPAYVVLHNTLFVEAGELMAKCTDPKVPLDELRQAQAQCQAYKRMLDFVNEEIKAGKEASEQFEALSQQ